MIPTTILKNYNNNIEIVFSMGKGIADVKRTKSFGLTINLDLN